MCPPYQQRKTGGKEKEKGRARPRARINQKERAKASRATAHAAPLAEAGRVKAKAAGKGAWHANGSRKASARTQIAGTNTSSPRINEMSNSLPGSARGNLPDLHRPVHPKPTYLFLQKHILPDGASRKVHTLRSSCTQSIVPHFETNALSPSAVQTHIRV